MQTLDDSPEPKQKHFLATIVLSLGIVMALWFAWYIGATHYQRVVDEWISVGRKEGYDIQFDSREQFGFPRQTVLRYVNVRWKNPNGIFFHADTLDISADLWQTKKFNAKIKGQVEISAPSGDPSQFMVVGGEDCKAQVTLADDGSWHKASIDLHQAHMGRSPDYLSRIGHMHLEAERPEQPPIDITTAGLKLSSDFDDISLPEKMPPTFGNTVKKLRVVAWLMGPVPDFRDAKSVDAWDKMNGLVNFDRLDLEWGPLLVNSHGAMNFDDDRQPEGAFSSVVGHMSDVIDLLSKDGFIASTQQEILHTAMSVLAKPTTINGEKGIEVPIAVQLGGFYIGPIKIFSYPPILW